MNRNIPHLNMAQLRLPKSFSSFQPLPQHQTIPESQPLHDGAQMMMMSSVQPEPIEPQNDKHPVLEPAKKIVLTNVSDLSSGRKFSDDIFHIGKGVHLQHRRKSVNMPDGRTFKYNAITLFRIGADGNTSMTFDVAASMYDALYTALDKMVEVHPPTYSRC